MNSFLNGLLWSFLAICIMILIFFVKGKKEFTETKRLNFKREVVRIFALWGIVMLVIFLLTK